MVLNGSDWEGIQEFRFKKNATEKEDLRWGERWGVVFMCCGRELGGFFSAKAACFMLRSKLVDLRDSAVAYVWIVERFRLTWWVTIPKVRNDGTHNISCWQDVFALGQQSFNDPWLAAETTAKKKL